MTFNQIDACAKLVQTLARMEIPQAHDPDDMPIGHPGVRQYMVDAAVLYTLIEEARDILKQSRANKTRLTSNP